MYDLYDIHGENATMITFSQTPTCLKPQMTGLVMQQTDREKDMAYSQVTLNHAWIEIYYIDSYMNRQYA